MKQRLRGWGGNLSRQAGGRAAGGEGIGGRGPGETKIETDRRRINTKIAKLRRELAHMKGTRDTKRQERRRHHIPSVAIAGYTNAGKSSLLNRLTGAGVLVEDALFATLDPTTRRTTTADGRVYTLSDTVGFVRHLPHQLVEAFRSTLEEVADSDLILHVVDGSHPDPEGQIAAVREVFAEIGADKVPEIIVINKADAADPLVVAQLLAARAARRRRQRHTGEGIDELLAGDRGRPAAAGRRVRRPACRTRAATCSTRSTSRARSSRSTTPATARSSAAAPTPTWPASSRRTPSDRPSVRRGPTLGSCSPPSPCVTRARWSTPTSATLLAVPSCSSPARPGPPARQPWWSTPRAQRRTTHRAEPPGVRRLHAQPSGPARHRDRRPRAARPPGTRLSSRSWALQVAARSPSP